MIDITNKLHWAYEGASDTLENVVNSNDETH